MSVRNGIGAGLKAITLARSAHLKGKREAQDRNTDLMMALARIQAEREQNKGVATRAAASERRAEENHERLMRAGGFYPAPDEEVAPTVEAPASPRTSINHSGVVEEHVSDEPGFQKAAQRRQGRLQGTDNGGNVTLDTPQRPPIAAPQPPKKWLFSPDSTTAARTRQAGIASRAAEIRAWNATQPEGKRLSDGEIETISLSPGTFDQWSKRVNGLDATTGYKERRQFAIDNPLPSRSSSRSGPNPTTSASQRERYFSQLAKRAIEASGGDPQKAAAALVAHPETANVFSEGMSSDHLNAAARAYRQKNGTPYGSPSPTAPAPRRGAITGLSQPATGRATPSEQQRDWDEAAAALRKSGVSNPAEKIGPRPAR